MYTADERVAFLFSQMDPSVDIILNDVSITFLPLDCSSLILNSDFEIGRADHWRATDSKSNTVPGYNSEYAIRNYERNGPYHGLQQSLDQR
eukprot:6289559-Ditylum_brightwellii.AAC.1